MLNTILRSDQSLTPVSLANGVDQRVHVLFADGDEGHEPPVNQKSFMSLEPVNMVAMLRSYESAINVRPLHLN